MNIREKEPIHPGCAVKEIIKGRLGGKLNISIVAKALKIGRPALSRFLNGKSGISIPLATKIDSYFGFDREVLLRMQLEYDIYKHDTRFIRKNQIPSEDILKRLFGGPYKKHFV